MTRQKRNVRDTYVAIAAAGAEPAQKLGWLSADNQRRNFEVAFALALEAGAAPSSMRVHDAGCGMGHFYDFLQANGGVREYVGTDGNEDFIADAMLEHPGVDFRRINLLSHPAPEAELTFALGLLSFHDGKSIRQLLNTLWKATTCAMVFNSWWELAGTGSPYAEEQPDIQSAVMRFCNDKSKDDCAVLLTLDGREYGDSTERMFALCR